MDKESYNEGFRAGLDAAINLLKRLRDLHADKRSDKLLEMLLGE